jgi:hypothetical protein
VNIEQLFDEISTSMRADLARCRTALSHPGMKGEAFEEIVRQFLRSYLPKFLEVTRGTLIDVNGNQSRELDVIVFDSQHTPVLFASGDSRVIPVECAYAVIEVKAFLDSGEIARIFTNMKSVRALSKKVWRQRPHPVEHSLYGQKWEIWPVMYFVFAFDSIDLMNVSREIDTRHQLESLPAHSRVDAVCVLDKGVVLNRLPNGAYQATPTLDSWLFVCPTPRSLLMFYMMIFSLLEQASLPPFDLRQYLMHVTWC